MDSLAYQVLAAIAAARGDGAAADAHACLLLDQTRENREPQTLLSSLGECARLALEVGGLERSQSLVDELAAAYADVERPEVDVGQLSAFVAAAALDRADELEVHLRKVALRSPWAEACTHIAAGRLEEGRPRRTPTRHTSTRQW